MAAHDVSPSRALGETPAPPCDHVITRPERLADQDRHRTGSVPVTRRFRSASRRPRITDRSPARIEGRGRAFADMISNPGCESPRRPAGCVLARDGILSRRRHRRRPESIRSRSSHVSAALDSRSSAGGRSDRLARANVPGCHARRIDRCSMIRTHAGRALRARRSEVLRVCAGCILKRHRIDAVCRL